MAEDRINEIKLQKAVVAYKRTHPHASKSEIEIFIREFKFKQQIYNGFDGLADEPNRSYPAFNENNNPPRDFNVFNYGYNNHDNSTPQNRTNNSDRDIVFNPNPSKPDSTRINSNDKFIEQSRRQEEQIREHNQPTALPAQNPQQIVRDAIQNKINELQRNLIIEKNQQGIIGKAWDWMKNTTGLGAGSNKVQKELDSVNAQLRQLDDKRHPANINNIYESVTGRKLNNAEMQRLVRNGEQPTLKAERKFHSYKEGQKVAVDIAGDLASGIVSFGIYAGAVMAAPFTLGGSIAVGVVAAAAVSAAVKVGVKSIDAATGGRNYTWADARNDSITGVLNGALAPVTAGIGGAVGKAFAVNVMKIGIKEVAEETAANAGKAALINFGNKYVGGNLLKRVASYFVEASAAGGSFGAPSSYVQNGLETGHWDDKNALEATERGLIGGILTGGILDIGSRFTGKIGSKISERIFMATAGAGMLRVTRKALATKEVAEALEKIKHLDMEEFARKAYEILVEKLGMKDVAPELILTLNKELKRKGTTVGGYNRLEGKIYLATDRIEDKADCINTLVHELCHAEQFALIARLRGETPSSLRYAFVMTQRDREKFNQAYYQAIIDKYGLIPKGHPDAKRAQRYYRDVIEQPFKGKSKALEPEAYKVGDAMESFYRKKVEKLPLWKRAAIYWGLY